MVVEFHDDPVGDSGDVDMLFPLILPDWGADRYYFPGREGVQLLGPDTLCVEMLSGWLAGGVACILP